MYYLIYKYFSFWGFVIVLDYIAFYQVIILDILFYSKPELVSNFLIQPNISCCLQLVSIYSRMKCDTFPSQPLRKWKKKKTVLFSCQRSVQNIRINILFCIETLLPRHINSNMWFISMLGFRYEVFSAFL